MEPAWEVSAGQEIEYGLPVDGVDLGQPGEAGAFVDPVQALVFHAETGGRPNPLTSQQIADVAGPRGLRADRKPCLFSGLEQCGGGLLVPVEPEGRPGRDSDDVGGSGGGQVCVKLGDRFADYGLGVASKEGVVRTSTFSSHRDGVTENP